jgi:two-component system LytT family response regulator
VRALDYLLKPPTDERLHRTVERIRKHVADSRAAELGQQVRDMVTAGASRTPISVQPLQPASVLHARQHGRIIFVRPDDIDWIEAAGNYVRLHLGSRSLLARYSIRQLETRLADHGFTRIHRGILVKTDRIVEMQQHFHGDYVAILEDRTVLKVGRTYRDALLDR